MDDFKVRVGEHGFGLKKTEYKGMSMIDDVKSQVCCVHPFGKQVKYRVVLSRWPSLWQRFWFRVFFGWRFEAVKEDE